MVDGRVDVGVPHHPPQCIELRSRIREIGAVESPKGVAGRIDVGLSFEFPHGLVHESRGRCRTNYPPASDVEEPK